MPIPIKLKSSVVKDKTPDPNSIEIGEVCVGAHSESPMLLFKDNADNIIKIQPGSGVTPSPDAPDNKEPGDLWFNETDNSLNYWDGNNWVTLEASTGSPGVEQIIAGDNITIDPVAGTGTVTINASAATLVSDSAPDITGLEPGQLWFNSNNGRLYVLYEDADSTQWIDASPNITSEATETPDLQAVTDKGNTTTGSISAGDFISAGNDLARLEADGRGNFKNTVISNRTAGNVWEGYSNGNLTSVIHSNGDVNLGYLNVGSTTTTAAKLGSDGILNLQRPDAIPSNGEFIFGYHGNTETFRVEVDGHIKARHLQFKNNPGSSDPNTLDDYEEGTWTPEQNTAWFSNKTQIGKYTKIGNVVTVSCHWIGECVDYSAANAVTTINLPFAIAPNDTGAFAVAVLNGGDEFGVTSYGTTKIYLSKKGSAIASTAIEIPMGLINTGNYPTGVDVTISFDITYTTNA